jgi:shikimate kinase
MRKVILIGFMGSGKSSVAPLLATKLGYSLVDLDSLIVQQSGFPSIPALFSEKGEPEFRNLEAHVANSLRNAEQVVISTGGGIVGRSSNIENLKHGGGAVVFLKTSFDEIRRRISDMSARPLFQNPEQAAALYETRLPLYNAYADITVSTDGKTPDEVCSEITNQLELQT